MKETEIKNILEEYIINDDDYFKVADYIEDLNSSLYAKNNTNKLLIVEKKELQQRNNKAIEYIKTYIEIDEETGTYTMPYTFDAHNLYKLLKKLEGDE